MRYAPHSIRCARFSLDSMRRSREPQSCSSEESAGTARADVRREVRAALAAQDGLRDIDFEHVEAAVRTIERGGSGRFHMKKGVELRIEQGIIVAEDEMQS